uniref:AraC-type transcription regulator ligand-binding domain-containing protein n=1 Tax=Streptomyces rochei TaxID=1928 RepID=D2KTB6_STRRO|nr:hypothetical protein [Streptomyces rochei]
MRGEISRRLLDALPVVLRVGSGGGPDPVWDHLAAEVAADRPGQQVVLDRLLDWMLVCALREYFDRPDGTPPGATRWWAARFACCTRNRQRRLPRLLAGPGCRGPRWRSGSPTWLANRR